MVDAFKTIITTFVAFLLGLFGLAIVDLAYDPPYQIVTDLVHHEKVPHRFIVLAPFSVTVIAVAIAVAFKVVLASKSKVIVQEKPFWNSNRAAMVASVTAIVSAFVGTVTAFVKLVVAKRQPICQPVSRIVDYDQLGRKSRPCGKSCSWFSSDYRRPGSV